MSGAQKSQRCRHTGMAAADADACSSSTLPHDYYTVHLQASGENFLRLRVHESGLLSDLRNFPFNGMPWHFKGVHFHPDGRRMVAYNERGQVFCFDLRENKYFIVKSSSHGIDYCTFVNTYKHDALTHLLIAYRSGLTVIFDVHAMDVVGRLQLDTALCGPNNPISRSSVRAHVVLVRSDVLRAQCVISDAAGNITLWSLKRCKLLGRLDVREGIVDIQYNCSGNIVSVVLERSGIYWYKAANFELIRHFNLPASEAGGSGVHSSPHRFTAYCCSYLSRNETGSRQGGSCESGGGRDNDAFDDNEERLFAEGAVYDVCLLLSTDSRQLFQWIATAVVAVESRFDRTVRITTATKLLSVLEFPVNVQQITSMSVFSDDSCPGLDRSLFNMPDYESDLNASSDDSPCKEFTAPRLAIAKIAVVSGEGAIFLLQVFEVDWNSPGKIALIAALPPSLVHGGKKSHFATLRRLLQPRAIPVQQTADVMLGACALNCHTRPTSCRRNGSPSGAISPMSSTQSSLRMTVEANEEEEDCLVNALQFRSSCIAVGKYYFAAVGLDGSIKIFDKVTMAGCRLGIDPHERLTLRKRLPKLEVVDKWRDLGSKRGVKSKSSKSSKSREVREVHPGGRVETDEDMDFKIEGSISDTDKAGAGDNLTSADNSAAANITTNTSSTSKVLTTDSKKSELEAPHHIENCKRWSKQERCEYIAKLKLLYSSEGSLPGKRRSSIWKFLLDIDENTEAYKLLCAKGIHASFQKIEDKYPVKSKPALRKLQRICSCLAHWSAIFGHVDYLPSFVFPFMVVLDQEEEVVSFEICAALLLKWGHTWNTDAPHAPQHVVRLLDVILRYQDSFLYNHCVLNEVVPGVAAWDMMKVAFSEVLSRDLWVALMDFLLLHLESNPNFFYISSLALLRAKTLKRAVLLCSDGPEIRSHLRAQHQVSLPDLLLDIPLILGSLPLQMLKKTE